MELGSLCWTWTATELWSSSGRLQGETNTQSATYRLQLPASLPLCEYKCMVRDWTMPTVTGWGLAGACCDWSRLTAVLG